ncbi:Smg-4/UPF3 family-domain-containing protein [Phycomyces nitens]|nr:Smg-4/UPF3 family-domain-containing protein [Phycomyces nitens]
MSTVQPTVVPAIDPPQPTEADSTTTKDKAKLLADKAKKKKREKAKKKAKRASRKNVLKTKVIVRRLPPNLPEEIFMNTVKPWTTDENVDYKYYSMEAVIAFHQGFDGHIFVDSRGNESRAVVEFAPYQKIPKDQKTPDTRAGTIDSDPDYYKFLLMLKAEENKTPEVKEGNDGLSQIERLENRLALVSAQTIAAEQANKPKTTPLLEHLRAQKAAKDSAKAKLQAQKNSLRNSKKSAGTSAGSTSTQNGSQGGQGQPSAEAKKPGRRERGKRKKDDKKPNGTAEKAANSPDKPSSSERRPNNGKSTGNQPEKTGGDNKPGTGRSREGRSRKKAGASGGGQEKQQVIKVLNRQTGEDKAKSGNNSSPTPKRSG